MSVSTFSNIRSRIMRLDTPAPATGDTWREQVISDVNQPIRTGQRVLGVFVLIFGVWAITAPISSAVIASGVVISAGQNKLVQHPAGGAVATIHVRDGERVAGGDPIITLDPIVDEADLDRLRARLASARAVEARLVAQMDGAAKPDFPADLENEARALRGSVSPDGAVQPLPGTIVANQLSAFRAGRDRLQRELGGLREQLAVLDRQAEGLAVQFESRESQLRRLVQQGDKMRPLARAGYVARTRMDELDNQISQLRSDVAQLSSDRSATEHRRAEIVNRIAQVIAADRQTSAAELTDVRTEVAELRNQIRAADRIVDQRVLRAPVSGVITNLQTHTEGGVVQPGETLAEIVPADSSHFVEARVRPEDIENLHDGQKADIVITAFNRRLVDPLEAEVTYIAADAETDPDSLTRFFTIRLQVDPNAGAGDAARRIHNGMSAEVYIESDRRVFMSYLLKPVMDSFRRAFRES